MKHKFRLTPWGKSIVFGWGLIIAAAMFLQYGPATETRLFPVTSRYKIVSFEESGTGTYVRFEFTKLRQCTLVSFTWYKRIGEYRVAYTPVKVNGEPFIDQWTGKIRSARFFLPLPPEEIKRESFATTRHECHALWDTVTVVYP